MRELRELEMDEEQCTSIDEFVRHVHHAPSSQHGGAFAIMEEKQKQAQVFYL